MKFSVIVPVYNTEKYLSCCVNSILGQSYDDFEVILVDDGSSDSSGKICDNYAAADSRIKVIHTKNGGAAAARNNGIRAAVGEFLCFLDSDDYWDSELALKKICSVIDGETDIVQMTMKVLHKDGSIEHRNCDFSGYMDLTEREKIVRLIDEERFMVSAAGLAIRREFILENECLFKEGIRVEDVEWAIRMFSRAPRLRFLDSSFYVIRTGREGSVTCTVDYRHMCNYCEVIELSLKNIENCEGELKRALTDYVVYHILIASALCERTLMSKAEKIDIRTHLRLSCKKNMKHVTHGKKARLGALIYRVAGFGIMRFALGFYLGHRA